MTDPTVTYWIWTSARAWSAEAGRTTHPDQRRVVHVREQTHHEPVVSASFNHMTPKSHVLAVHSVSHAAVPRDRVSKVLDVEGSLETRGEETSERREKRRKGCHDEAVNREGRIRYRWRSVTQDRLEQLSRGAGELEVAPHKDRVGAADDIREDVGAEVMSRADHVRESHEKGAPLRVSCGSKRSVRCSPEEQTEGYR